jgi:hypothetical protein
VSAAPIVRALRAAAQSDPWRGTRTAALGALARQDREAALSLARAWLDRPAAATGHLHAAAAAVVGEHGTAADLSRLILAMRDRNPRDARHAAGNAAARLVAREESEGTRRAAAARVARAAEVMLDDADQTTRRTGVALLALVGDAQSAEALEAYRRAELVPALGKAAKDAARRIRRRGDLPEPETASVAARLEELEHELERVSGELEALSERR